MTDYPDEFYYTKTHECFRLDDNIAVVHITSYAIEQLGEITYVQLPEEGETLEKEDSFGEIESVKTVSDLYSPIKGEIIEINTNLEEEPELVNDSGYNKGWLIKVELSDPEAAVEMCLSPEAYAEYIEQLG